MLDNAAQKIKEKLDIVEFLRGYLELKPAGRNFKAHCPFHKEKTASFMVSPDKQIWHCFGCNEGGDVFKFLMKYENIEFYEALKILAEKTNISLGKISPYEQKEFGVLYDINRVAADYYRECLARFSEGSEYLYSRKISKNSIEEFEIGFAPNDWDNLAVHLVNKGFNIVDAVRAGLIVKTEKGKYIDRFRGRIIFPLESNFGKVIGFTGRILPCFDKGETGKYINSPETPIFSKSRLLYGLSKAKEHIREQKFILLTEGQMDVIMSHQDGIKNTIGVSGTALTEDQLVVLKRYSNKLIFNFDNDEAGKRAMERSIGLSQERDFEIEILDFSSIDEIKMFKDLADIVSNNPGVLKNIISRSVPAMEYYLSRYPITDENINFKKNNIREILKKIAGLSSAVERSYWMRELSFRSNVREKDLLSELESLKESNVLSLSNRFDKVAETKLNNSFGFLNKNRKEKIAAKLLSFYFVSDLAKDKIEKLKQYLPQTELELYNAIISDSSLSGLDKGLNENNAIKSIAEKEYNNDIIRQKIIEFSLKSELKEENMDKEILDLADSLEAEALQEERDLLSLEIKSGNFSEEEKLEKSAILMEIIKKIEKIKTKQSHNE